LKIICFEGARKFKLNKSDARKVIKFEEGITIFSRILEA